MIVATSPEARPLLLLAQERSQPSADEPVDSDEGARIGVLEVAEPTAERPVEIGDDASEAVAARMRENRPYGSEGGEGQNPSRPLSSQ